MLCLVKDGGESGECYRQELLAGQVPHYCRLFPINGSTCRVRSDTLLGENQVTSPIRLKCHIEMVDPTRIERVYFSLQGNA